jgi:transcriptional regulator with PAS, ATPase and Fis domain
LAEQLARWYAQQKTPADPVSPLLFSRLRDQDDLSTAVPALKGHTRSCVYMPIALHGQRFGLLYLGQSTTRSPEHVFGRPELDFLTVYMGFLALFIYEKSKGQEVGRSEHIPTPIEGIASFENIITQNEAMLGVLRLIQKVAPSDLTTLLVGETGTGKGLLAYAIHALSQRKHRKFMTINCAAIPESLLESELFGHVKGSFTSAHADKRGLLVEAEGGTVFLDEIGKMPLSMQGKLLQFLDTKVVRPVGSVREVRADVRIVCATKTDLKSLAERGLFLEDLYYRLLDFPLEIPPLRERRDDIQLLVQHFIERFARELGFEVPVCSAPFLDSLIQHDWPGNVRELEKCLKRAIVLAQKERILRTEHLPALMIEYSPRDRDPNGIAPLRDTLASVECREISQALKLARGNKAKAARFLKISYPNLLKKIRFYGIRAS